MINLSILIPSVPARMKFFLPRLLGQIDDQIEAHDDVEVIILYDNKKRILGKKRNDLLALAQGEYLAFIDDDDRISEDYLDEIMSAIHAGDSDCIVFDSICTINIDEPLRCKYGIEYEYNNAQPPNVWTGKPAHTMVYKSSLAKAHLYNDDSGYGEDMDWVARACKDIKIQHRIDKVLYYYDFNSLTTETR